MPANVVNVNNSNPLTARIKCMVFSLKTNLWSVLITLTDDYDTEIFYIKIHLPNIIYVTNSQSQNMLQFLAWCALFHITCFCLNCNVFLFLFLSCLHACLLSVCCPIVFTCSVFNLSIASLSYCVFIISPMLPSCVNLYIYIHTHTHQPLY